MIFYSGQNGRMEIDGTRAAKVTNWSITSSQSPLTTTTLGDTDSTYTSGLRNSTGSCRLYYYDDNSENSCSTLIRKLIKARTEGSEAGVAAKPDNVTFKLQVVEGSVSKQIEIEALLTSVSMSMSVGEVLAADVAFQVNGAVKSVTL